MGKLACTRDAEMEALRTRQECWVLLSSGRSQLAKVQNTHSGVEDSPTTSVITQRTSNLDLVKILDYTA